MHLLFYCPVPKDILSAALIFMEEEKLSELRKKKMDFKFLLSVTSEVYRINYSGNMERK